MSAARESAPGRKGSPPAVVPVFGRDGLRGTLDLRSQRLDDPRARVVVTLESGQRLSIPVDLLRPRTEGGFDMLVGPQELGVTPSAPMAPAGKSPAARSGKGAVVARIPVVEETAEILTQRVETGVVRIVKQVQERQEQVEAPVSREEVEVERVTVGRVLETPAQVRYEGTTLVVPVMEEVLVVEKRLVLREELHIRKRRIQERTQVPVTLRAETVTVERRPAGGVESAPDRVPQRSGSGIKRPGGEET